VTEPLALLLHIWGALGSNLDPETSSPDSYFPLFFLVVLVFIRQSYHLLHCRHTCVVHNCRYIIECYYYYYGLML
jgi:hypothetical protein